MSTKSSLILSLLAMAPVIFADQVVLKNGDVITGSIVKKDGAKLTLKSEFLGEVSMPWSAIKSVKSDQDLTVVLPGGESVLGKINTSGDTLEVVSPAATKSAPLAGVTAVRNAAEEHTYERLQHPSLLELWAGTYDVGLALTRGNSRTATLTNTFNAARITRKDKITVGFNEIYSTATLNGVSSAIASAIRGNWTYSRDLTPRFFVSTLNSYEHDRFQSLDLRFVVGGGFGVNAIKTDKLNLSFSGGGDYEHESFEATPTTSSLVSLSRNSGEANFGNAFLYKLSSVTSITQSFSFFPNLTETGEYRVNFDLSAVTAIKKWLGFHVTASDRFLSNPLPGRLRNDVLLSTGFRLSFAK